MAMVRSQGGAAVIPRKSIFRLACQVFLGTVNFLHFVHQSCVVGPAVDALIRARWFVAQQGVRGTTRVASRKD